MDEPSKMERVSGNLATGIAGTAVAALGSSITPLAAFVPFLLQSLASQRHSERIDKALSEINDILIEHGDAIKELSDPKYKFIGEAISTVFLSVDREKIEYLKTCIDNAVKSSDINEGNADYLARIIRDISYSEAKFLIDNFQYQNIFFGDGTKTIDNALTIKNGSEQEVIASGLINMGLLYSKVPTFDSVKFEFSPIVIKLLLLLKKNA